MGRKRAVFIALVILIMASSFWYTYRIASSVDDYIGDEVWYVSASRNVLHKLGLQVHYYHNGSEGVNVIFSNDSTKLRYLSMVDYYSTQAGTTMRREYSNFPGVYYEIPEKNLGEFLNKLSAELPPGSYYIVTGYWYPDKENIQEYFNLEHPFLGKDFIMMAMLVEDRPVNWRIPGLLAFLATQLLVLLATWRITRSYIASLIAILFTAADPVLQSTAVAAMLDIYVAFGVALFVFFLAYRKTRTAAVAIGLAAATKLSGAFGWPVLVYRALKEERDLLGFLMTVTVIPTVAFLVPNIPAMIAVGPRDWLNNFLGSFKWHLSYKGPNPNTSPFWQWFINYRPFTLHFEPNIFAQTDPFLLLAMVLFILAMPWLYRRREGILEPFLVFWSTVGFFALQYALGGRTQFSFYATVLVPPAAVVMGAALNELMRWEAFGESIAFYRARLGRAWGWLRGRIGK